MDTGDAEASAGQPPDSGMALGSVRQDEELDTVLCEMGFGSDGVDACYGMNPGFVFDVSLAGGDGQE